VMMDQQRAAELWALRGIAWKIPAESPACPRGMTHAEDDHVRRVWLRMPGYTCWMDAFFRILHGKAEEVR
jgi:hypothetical protein